MKTNEMQLCTNHTYFFFGWNGKLSEIERPNHYVFYDETADSIEVSLSSDSSSFHVKDDAKDVSAIMGYVLTDNNSQCAQSMNNTPTSCSLVDESESSFVSSSEESISSQQSYLQLAIPSSREFIYNAKGINDSQESEQELRQSIQPKCSTGTYQEEPRNLEPTETIDTGLKSDDTKLQQVDEISYSIGIRQDDGAPHAFQDSQGVIHYPKQRAIFSGPRQSKMSLHSRMEFWKHQLFKPIRALKVGPKSLRSPFRGDCLGRNVLNTISQQPTSSTETGLDDDSQLHSQDDLVEAMAERGIDGFTETSKERRSWFIRSRPNQDESDECLAHEEITDTTLVRNVYYDMRPAAADQQIIPPSHRECYSPDCAVGKQDNIPNETSLHKECPKRIVVIDFDDITLATRQGPTEEESTDVDDDESVLIMDWDLG